MINLERVMKTIDKINQTIKRLPARSQKEALHFIEFLLSKSGVIEEEIDVKSWNNFSLDRAMYGLENDDTPNYSENNLKEKYVK